VYTAFASPKTNQVKMEVIIAIVVLGLPFSNQFYKWSHPYSHSSFLVLAAPAKCWLLGILLLLTVATSWPTGTSAAPRRARGLHLILGHRQHHHHQHARSTDPISIIVPLPTNQTEGWESCSKMSITPNTSALIYARDVAINTREAAICLTQEWVSGAFECLGPTEMLSPLIPAQTAGAHAKRRPEVGHQEILISQTVPEAPAAD